MGCCTPSPQSKPNKTKKKLVWFLPWQGGMHEIKQVTSGDPVLTGVLHSKWSTFHSTFTHFFFHGAHKPLNKSPNICVLHKSKWLSNAVPIGGSAPGIVVTAWEAASDCAWSLPITSCHGFVLQVPLSAVLAARELCSHGKHLETNGWCRIQWVWKDWSIYHLILMISPFTAPKILTRLEWAARPVERLCGGWWCSILSDLATATAHKQPREGGVCSSGAIRLIQNR